MLVSSDVNEVIREVLNVFFIFYKKILHAQKAQNEHKPTKIKKGRVFMLLKSI